MMGHHSHWEGVLSRLKGKIHLITGNHDKKFIKKGYVTSRMESIQPYLELKLDNQYVVMCHYAMEIWNGSHKGSWQLFGHSHGSLDEWCRDRKSMDVGVDAENGENYAPISWEKVKQVMESRPVKFVDHHGSSTPVR